MTAVSFLLSTALASAQTAEPAPTDGSGTTNGTTSTTDGRFANLSPGNQKIARSLFEAQVAPAEPPPGGTTNDGTATGGTMVSATTDGTATATTGSAWTLDQIAAAKQSGQGWGNVFREMKAQGLIEAKNLGQVVSSKAIPPTTPPAPPPTGDTGRTDSTSGTGGIVGEATGTGGTAGETTSGGTITAATRSSGRRHFGGRDSEVIVTLGNNREFVAGNGSRSASHPTASRHASGRSDSGAGARGIDTGSRGSLVGTARGSDGRGQGRGGDNGGGRGH